MIESKWGGSAGGVCKFLGAMFRLSDLAPEV